MTKAVRAQVSLIPQYAMSALDPGLIADAARAPAGQDGAARGGAGTAADGRAGTPGCRSRG